MHSVDVDYAGRSYRVTFAGREPDARCLRVHRRIAGGAAGDIDMFGVKGRAVIAAAREKMA